MTHASDTAGDMLREWRRRRRLSQLDLAGDAGVSARHLSYMECGRAAGSREMLLRLAERLAMPLRERNRLLLAAGYAPVHPERPLGAPDMAAARAAVDGVLAGHMPFPALAVDRHWTLVEANGAVAGLLTGVSAELLTPPVNVLRLSLHPKGLAPRIANFAEWRHHLLDRLNAQAEATGDPVLFALHRELSALPARTGRMPAAAANPIAVPLQLRVPESGMVLSLLSATTVFGTATEVTLSEMALECFYPADDETRAFFLNPAPETRS
ncbi:helix-turn-helix transcriptional regulator [Aquabacter sp. CN5-332]|uniref:helix-turn-helix domain-containing protein n=1 Tax=Aquabacter sp. CN5-332 TaxID=3156608 RepID=UPI0032B4C42B